ncbi:hypothetical protein BGW80DRAFT_1274909, partial [Lactifluus volemus]
MNTRLTRATTNRPTNGGISVGYSLHPYSMTEDRECRILVISASLENARTAVKLIKTLKKYYFADVHFHLVEYAQWDPQLALRVPAVIFVWTRGQPYVDHVFALHNGIARFEPEVALAISLGNEPAHPTDPPEGPDPFLADHGFEYIDGERTRHPTSNADAEDERRTTIMWPSMIRDPDSGKKRKSRRQSPSIFDFDVLRMGTTEEEDTLAALMVADAADHGVPLTRANRVQNEMAALERWLIENEELHESEIRGATASPDGIDDEDGDVDDESEQDEERDEDDGDSDLPSSVPSMSPSTAPCASGDNTTVRPSGFDDDFTAFTLLPPSHTASSSRSMTPLAFDDDNDDDAADDHVGYEALDDDHGSSFEFDFSPTQHEHERLSDERTSMSMGGGGVHRGPGLNDGDENELQTVREDVAGIGDEARRREMTARFASEFVFKRMGMDDGDIDDES